MTESPNLRPTQNLPLPLGIRKAGAPPLSNDLSFELRKGGHDGEEDLREGVVASI
jgi:hypothetical protein